VSYSGRDGLTRRVGKTALGHNSQAVSVGLRGGDSPLTQAPVLCQNIKCSGRGSGCRRGGPASASSETESHPRGRPALERGGVPPEGAVQPSSEAESHPRGVQHSSEAKFRRYGVVPLERSGVSPEGCRGRPFGGPLRFPGPWAPVTGP
jgi:hypothetical protein